MEHILNAEADETVFGYSAKLRPGSVSAPQAQSLEHAGGKIDLVDELEPGNKHVLVIRTLTALDRAAGQTVLPDAETVFGPALEGNAAVATVPVFIFGPVTPTILETLEHRTIRTAVSQLTRNGLTGGFEKVQQILHGNREAPAYPPGEELLGTHPVTDGSSADVANGGCLGDG